MKQQILLAAVLALSLLTVSGCAGEENRGADIGTQSAVQSREDGPSTSSRGEIPEPAPAPEQSEPETPVQDDFVMIGLGEEPLDEETLQLCRAAMNYCESSTGYRPGVVRVDSVDEEGVTLQIYDDMGTHTATAAWYCIDPGTMEGSDIIPGEEISFSSYMN